jgi:hypothetical protein
MNIVVSQLKSAATNPEKKDAAIGQLRAIAGNTTDPRATDALLVLRELGCTENGQERPVTTSGGISETADAELLEALTKFPVGGTPEDPRSSEAQIFYDDLLTCIYYEQYEPRILANRKFVYRTSRHALVREKAFWAIAGIAFAGDYPRGLKQALAFIESERPNYTKDDFINSPYRPMQAVTA